MKSANVSPKRRLNCSSIPICKLTKRSALLGGTLIKISPIPEGDLAANTKYSVRLAHEFLAEVRAQGGDGVIPSLESRLHYARALICEVAAIARISCWEHAGLLPLIDPSLPSADEAWRDLNRRYLADKHGTLYLQAPLFRRVLLAWNQACITGSVAELGGDLLVGELTSDAFDLLLRPLWRHARVK